MALTWPLDRGLFEEEMTRSTATRLIFAFLQIEANPFALNAEPLVSQAQYVVYSGTQRMQSAE